MDDWILAILAIMPGVWSGDWGVSFQNRCALNGTSVDIPCSYDYPDGHTVTEVEWSKLIIVSDKMRRVPLSELPSIRDRNTYVGDHQHRCNLKINNVQRTDEGQYRFRFVTSGDRWKSKTSAFLFVRAKLTAVLKPSTVTEGDTVTLTCGSGCPATIDVRTVWFRDGQRMLKTVFQARRDDAGMYYCAMSGQEMFRSASVALDVQYTPTNVSVFVDPQVTEGSSVNLTCSSVANPAPHNYTWYKRPDPPSSSSMVQVGSGQVLSLPSVNVSHTGHYSCQARNTVGVNNSTEVLLKVTAAKGSSSVPVIAGVGVCVLAILLIVLLFFWKKQRTNDEKKTTSGNSPSPKKDEPDAVYANIHTFPSATQIDAGVGEDASQSQENSHHRHDEPTRNESDVTYSTVIVKPSRASPETRSETAESDAAVIYTVVSRSS